MTAKTKNNTFLTQAGTQICRTDQARVESSISVLFLDGFSKFLPIASK